MNNAKISIMTSWHLLFNYLLITKLPLFQINLDEYVPSHFSQLVVPGTTEYSLIDFVVDPIVTVIVYPTVVATDG